MQGLVVWTVLSGLLGCDYVRVYVGSSVSETTFIFRQLWQGYSTSHWLSLTTFLHMWLI